MKFIMVHMGPIKKYPPAISIIKHLNDLGYDLILCTTDIDNNTKKMCQKRNIKFIDIKIDYEKPIPIVVKFIRMIYLRYKLWNEIDKVYDDDTIIWVFSDLALKHLGNRLLKRSYILHMFELSEKTLYFHKLPQLALNNQKFAQNALAVIQAEYNRAHIAKAWWHLEKLPYVLPNKTYDDGSIQKKSVITDKYAASVIQKLKEKKIIIYQGTVNTERPLQPFIKAIDTLGDDYAFVVMSNSENIYKDVESNNFYFIPFVSPPFHLEVTSHAYIGILTYVPTNNEFSKLNALYCAPNKLYEYSMFGIPMIGNDIPGLKYTFDLNGMGKCFSSFDEQSIVSAIENVEENYDSMAIASKKFYNDTDIKGILNNIISDIKRRKE